MSRTYKKPYTGAKKVDKSCRCNGGCPYCKRNRMYKTNKEIERTDQELKEYRKIKKV